jgi:catechol 2,3-dioxygenase-like lactoylglutathione lyase family enzyme
MITGIDHIVVVVGSLEGAIANYSKLGFTVVAGGSHAAYGSRNALIAFADGSYLELIAFENPTLNHPWVEKLAKGGGLIDFCFQTSDLRADVDAYRRAGVEISDPSPLTRTRPDGYLLKWVLAIPGRDSGTVPFLIEDETPRDERVPKERAHPNGALGIAALTVAVEALQRLGTFYSRLLGTPPKEIDLPDLGASGKGFAVGSNSIELLTPKNTTGPLAEWIRVRGPSPFAARFKSASKAGSPLDPSLTLGARFAFG